MPVGKVKFFDDEKGFGFILELCYLNPRKEIGASYDQDVFTLIKVK